MPEPAEVLIVEDEPVVLLVAGKALAVHGIGYQQATDVPSAVALLEQRAFKVVLTDLKLPGDSGFDILELARRQTPPPQVVIITGYATIDNALESFRQGAFDFIPKPFDVDELASVACRALRFADLTATETALSGESFGLGRHSWARLDPDGSATLGVAETLSGVVGQLAGITCPESGDHTIQGQVYCQLEATDGLTHKAWAPLSGQVIMQNPDIIADPDRINSDPCGTGWIVRIIPSRLEKELPKLRQPRPAPPG